jgi:glycosyltransferase involved in cell wall biosynthesis
LIRIFGIVHIDEDINGEMSIGQKTIMHLIATNFYGGPDKQIVEHLRRLNKSGYRGVVASFLEYGGRNETLEKAKLVGLGYHGIPMCGPLDVKAQLKVVRLIRQERVDLLCVHGYKACVMGWWAAKRAKIPVLAFSRGYTTETPRIAFYEWLERRVLESMAGIIFVSEGQKKKLESFGIRGRKSWVVYNAVSVNSLKGEREAQIRGAVFNRLGIQENSKLVVTAGRLSPEKGHRFLIEGIQKMCQQINGTYFVFCGDGPCKKDIEKQAQDLGIWDQCRFLGFRRDLQEIFCAMDLMVLPSLTEGLPNVILEAFARAKPVVATNVGGVPEIVENGINGLLVPPRRPDLLAEAIARCIATPRLMRAIWVSQGKITIHF